MRCNRKICWCLVIGFAISFAKLLALDTLKTKPIKLPKHYFTTTVYADYYAPSKRILDTVNRVSNRLKSYKVSQFTLGFSTPIITKDFYNKDSTRIKNLHFLLTGGITNLNLDFEGIKVHTFSKKYLGFRGLYNNGKKSIFFVEVAPFISQDRGYKYTTTIRMSATLLYNCAINESFSFRVGYTRSFLHGNLSNLPYIGIRVGKLDKLNFSLQFPRSISLNFPIGKYIQTSVYTKPQGGFYTFANTDSIALGSVYENKTLFFGRSEYLLGTRIDILPSRYFNFYLSGGLTTRNTIEFFPSTNKANIVYSYTKNYKERIDGGAFLNVGMVIRFGKTKSIYNNFQMYNAIDMNNSNVSGDNNLRNTNGEIPSGKERMGKNKTDDVIDLIEAQDLY